MEEKKLPVVQKMKDSHGVLYLKVDGTIARLYKKKKESKAERKKRIKEQHQK